MLFIQDKYDLLVIPGGAKGAETISGNSPVQHLVREYLQTGKFVGMICAGERRRSRLWHLSHCICSGSLTALTSGLQKQPLTSHPSVRDQLKESEESIVHSCMSNL